MSLSSLENWRRHAARSCRNSLSCERLAEVRVELAKRYLARGTVSASEVAYLIGFAEPQAFFRAFKRWTGQTPREFQHRAPS